MGRIFKIALALFLVGVGVVATFTAISGENLFSTVNEEDFVYNELVYDGDEFSNFDFDFENRGFTIRTSDDDQIKITYYTTEKDNVVVTEGEETLKLLNDIEWYDQWFIGINFFTNNDYYDVYLFLPSSIIYDLDINTSNGTIDILNIDNISNLDFYTSNGKILIVDVETDEMNLHTSNGEIRITDVGIELDLYLKTSNGRIYLTNITAKDIDAYSSNGRIIASNIDCNSAILDTSNGDIEVEIKGDKADYEVNMDTSNGDMIYDGIGVTSEHFNEGATYVLDLDTSNGDIEVSFIE
ncbi:DUF4097 family beta strand repeat-containing protein [Mycoplasmatota bacterium WC30]